MLVVEIVGNTVAAPRSAAHRQRERQCVVVTTPGREAVRLIDYHAAHRQRFAQVHGTIGLAGLQTHRMTGTLEAENAFGQCGSSGKIGDAIHRQHRRQFFSRKRMSKTYTGLRDHQESRGLQRRARQTGDTRNLRRRLGDNGRRELAFGKHRLLQQGCLLRRKHCTTLCRQRQHQFVVDVLVHDEAVLR